MALELGIGETALRRWVGQAEIEAGRGPAEALKRGEREELVELRRENQQLGMEREILKKQRPSSPSRANEIRFYRNGEATVLKVKGGALPTGSTGSGIE